MRDGNRSPNDVGIPPEIMVTSGKPVVHQMKTAMAALFLCLFAAGCGGGGGIDRGEYPPIVSTIWTRSLGGDGNEAARSVIQASDDSFVLAGYTDSFGEGGKDALVMKLNIYGNTVWGVHFGGPLNDMAFAVRESSDKTYIGGGIGAETATSTPGILTFRISTDGELLWAKVHSGTTSKGAYDAQICADGGLILAGFIYDETGTNQDILLMRTDALGNELWTVTYNRPGNQYANAVSIAPDGGYIVAGQNQSAETGDWDMRIMKTDAAGSVEWERNYGGFYYDVGNSVVVNSDGTSIMAGTSSTFNTTHDQLDALVVKFSAAGDMVWTKTYGGTMHDGATSIQPTSDGKYILSGYSESFSQNTRDIWIFKIDSTGNQLWEQAYGLPDYETSYAVRQTIDGGYIVAGYTEYTTRQTGDIWMLKLNSSGACPGCDLPQ